MTQEHPLDDADLVDFADGEAFEADLDEDFVDDDDFGDDEDDDFVEDEDDDFVEDEGDDFVEDGADLVDDGGDKKGSDDGDDEDLEEDDDVPLPPEEDDDEDVHPSDVEADLEEILRDRIAASDDDEEDEEEEAAGQAKTPTIVAPPRSDEWTCNQCFLIVSVTQFGSRSDPVCPSGEEPCESIERIVRG